MSAIVQAAIRQALTEYLPAAIDTVGARLMMLAAQKQEDPEERRYQVVKRTAATAQENIVGPRTAKGPARGLWQFEKGGGVAGVMHFGGKVGAYALDVCDAMNIPFQREVIWSTLESNDVLAACFARLLLLSDPKKLPLVDDPFGAFELYLRTWRPGAFVRGDDSQKQALHAKFLKNHAAARLELNIQ
jgi:hypothetical protein